MKKKTLASVAPTLDTPLADLLRLTPIHKAALAKLHLTTARHLLYYFPTRYGHTAKATTIASLAKGDNATVFGTITSLATKKGFHSKIPMATATVTDDTGTIQCTWFHQPYIAKMLQEGSLVRLDGPVSARQKTGVLYFSNPSIEPVDAIPIAVGGSLFGSATGENDTDIAGRLYPVYPETKGLTSLWLYHAVQKVIKAGVLENLIDPLPESLREAYHLPSLRTALIWLHTPQKEDDAKAARKRCAFDEMLYVQLVKQQAKRAYQQHKTWRITASADEVEAFVKRFPFEATDAQRRAIAAITTDFTAGRPMTRLLEGDVGSGKTAVAAATAYAVIHSRAIVPPELGATATAHQRSHARLQVAYLCPTEILATQQFESFIRYFSYLGVSVGLITGNGCRKFPSKINPTGWTDISRSQFLTWVANGEIPIVIGTHALIQKSVVFRHLAYVIIDEQHRFGTKQRAALIKKNVIAPHLLSMTATPIPRTLALTAFGDLDLTVLDALPVGRKPVITKIVGADERARGQVYNHIRGELAAGRQAYVICPRIDDPDPAQEAALQARSAIAEAKRLKKDIFPEQSIDVLHSKMLPAKKDAVMAAFAAGKINILCATSVVEVGVNVPNATIMIIEGGERFGLAQLHQLRGRVQRSSTQAYCYVFTSNGGTETTSERLKAFTAAKNGFELAEYDLAFRGAGELLGGKQWGISDVAMEALANIKLVEAARLEAGKILDTDPLLQEAHHTALIHEMNRRHRESGHAHLE